MIVRSSPDGSLTLITQNDHARLSGLMAAHWGNDRFARPRPYDSVVRATHYHDLGWLEYEANPQFDAKTGRTPNFLQIPNDREHLDAFQRSHKWLQGRSLRRPADHQAPYRGVSAALRRSTATHAAAAA